MAENTITQTTEQPIIRKPRTKPGKRELNSIAQAALDKAKAENVPDPIEAAALAMKEVQKETATLPEYKDTLEENQVSAESLVTEVKDIVNKAEADSAALDKELAEAMKPVDLANQVFNPDLVQPQVQAEQGVATVIEQMTSEPVKPTDSSTPVAPIPIVITEDSLATLIASITAKVKAELLSVPTSTGATTTVKPTSNGSSRAPGIGEFIYEILADESKAGLTYKEIAEIAVAKFNSKTTAACIAWYISHAEEKGKKVVRRNSALRTQTIVNVVNPIQVSIPGVVVSSNLGEDIKADYMEALGIGK